MAAPLPDSDGDLVLLALEGRQDAFSALYERYFPSVFDFLTRMLRNREEAADVAQDAFIKALEQLGNLKNPERFKSWLFTIAHRTGLNRIRSSKRTKAVGRVDDDERATMAVADPDPTSNPEQMAATQEAADIVWEAAALLDPRTYAVMDLHVRQGLDSAEIAEVMGVTKGNAYTMVSRMKQSFSNTLATYLLVRKGRQDCDDLAGIVEPDVTKMTPDLRRKADRHVAKCSVCSENKAIYFEPVKLFAALMLVPIPAGLKASIWGAVAAAGAAAGGATATAGQASGAPASSRSGRAATAGSTSPVTLVAAVAAIAALVLIVIVGGFFLNRGGEATFVALDAAVLGPDTPFTNDPEILGPGSGGSTGRLPDTTDLSGATTTPTTAPDAEIGPPDSTFPPGELIVVDDAVALSEDTSLSVDVMANDAGSIDPSSLAVVSSPSNGRALTSASGVIIYTPDPNYAGSDQLTYSVADTVGNSGTGVVTLSVRQVNDVPVVPGPSLLALDEDTSATFAPLAGASDVDGDDLAIASFDAVSAAGGSVSSSGGTYEPPADFSGSDSYSYIVSDGEAHVTVTVAIKVDPIDDPPRPPTGGITATVAEDSSTSLSVLAGWVDPDGDALTAAAGTFVTANGGTVVITSGGTATYSPPANFAGSDTFTYTVKDGDFTITGTATVTVTATNDAPSVTGATFVVDANAAPGTVVGRVSATDPDAGETLTYAIVAGNTGSQLKINNSGDITVNAITDTSVFPLSLTVRVTDSTGLTDSATVTVQIVDTSGPSISNFSASPTTINTYAAPGVPCPSGVSNSTISATVTDPSGVASVSFSYSGTIAGQVFSGTVPTTLSGNTATGDFAIVINGFPFTSATFNFTATATDSEGNTSQATGVTVTVLPCP